MSFKIKRHKNNTEEEKNILINSIISSDFLSEVSRVMKKEYLLSDASRILWSWIIEYYKNYSQAPGKLIQDIFNTQKDKLDDNDAKLIHELLTGLNQKYGENINNKYETDKAIKYIKKRALEEHVSKVKSLIELGQIDEAEREQVQYKQVMKQTSNWVNPFDEEFIKEIRTKKDENILFTFDGALGELVGPLQRGWCICALGKFGFGKSWLLGEMRNLALLNRLKVCEFNLEMNEYDTTDRLYRRILSRGVNDGNYLLPVFDCLHNMTGTCKKKERKNREILFNPKNETKPIPNIKSFRPEDTDSVDIGPPSYKTCDYCRRNKKYFSDYNQEIWYEKKYKEGFDEKDIIKKTKAIKRMYGDNYRLMAYPKFSSNVQNIRNDLDILEYTENFTPDVVIVDYPGILAVEDSRLTNEEQHLNQTWMALCQLGSEKNILVIGAAQVKYEAMKKKSLGLGDNSQSVRSISANCNLIIGLFGTTEEEELGIARINVIKHRHREYNSNKEVVILRQFELGQTILDSDWKKDD